MDFIKPNLEQTRLIRETFSLSGNQPVPVLHPMEGGITNNSFRFTCRDVGYILREPGVDSEKYVDRYQEAASYKAVQDLGISDDIIVLEPDSGQKITRFWPSARICDPANPEDVRQCMALLRNLHDRALHVPYRYDILTMNHVFDRMMPETSWHADHDEVQKRCYDMAPFLETYLYTAVLSHCDTVAANFLFINENGEPGLRLIDWEYAGECDPCVDLGMFANDADFDPEQVDWMIRSYLGTDAPSDFTLRVYGYLALTGMMFSNWAEYICAAGMNYKEYGDTQYRHAEFYSRLFWKLYHSLQAD